MIRMGNKKGKSLTMVESHKKVIQPGPLHPYRPHTDKSYDKVFGPYDILYTTALLVKPGK